MHEREDTIFNAALDCSSEIERSQFLNQACGDNLELALGRVPAKRL